MSAGQELGWVGRAGRVRTRSAVRSVEGEHTYADLLRDSETTALGLLAGGADLEAGRVAFLVPPSYAWVRTLWGIWRAGGVAVPLCVSHPPPELEYVVEDSGAQVLVAACELAPRLTPIAERLDRRLVSTEELGAGVPIGELPVVTAERRAMIVYTSGSTGRPKGVVTTHRNIEGQIEPLVEAWGWRPSDSILSVLPLHHVHGIVNVVGCALWTGAVCEMMPRFDAGAVWERFASGSLTLFMAVPTIYVRLIAAWESAPEERRRVWSQAAAGLRLMVSGSAALPVRVLERWLEITGHRLLERYGMTETGMILSNPLDGERRPGFVGQPLPGVEVRLRADDGSPAESQGEVEVRSRGVFQEYWGREQETAATFHDGWFRTGDVAVLEGGSYRLLGRQSVDILKTGGYKVSALEIEEVLRQHPGVSECAVVGVPDQEWGERVAAALVCSGEPLTLEALREWARQRLAPYKTPSRLLTLDALPRNALGKVTKPAVVALFERAARSGQGAA